MIEPLRRRAGLASILAFALATITGLIGLLGYFLREPLFAYLRGLILQGGVALAGVALITAVLAYFFDQVRRARRDVGERPYAFAAALAFMIAAWLTLIQGSTGEGPLWIMDAIILPAESALLAVLAVLMLTGMARMIARRGSRFAWTFFLSTFICLVGTLALNFDGTSTVERILAWFRNVPGGAGIRGLILGAALGGALTGLRILTGFERPYDEGA